MRKNPLLGVLVILSVFSLSTSGRGMVAYSHSAPVHPDWGPLAGSVEMSPMGFAGGQDPGILPPVCFYLITPQDASFPSCGGTGSVEVSASISDCHWTATSNDSWITISSGSSGIGSGTVNFSLSANSSSSPRTGTLTIIGHTFTVTQAGAGTDEWTSVISPSEGYWYLSDVHFTSPAEGWAVGNDDKNGAAALLHYSGLAWSSVSPLIYDVVLYGVHFTSPGEGWAVGRDSKSASGALLHYSDGMWTPVSPPPVSSNWFLQKVHFPSPNEGWAVVADVSNYPNHASVFLHYTGETWTSVNPPAVEPGWYLYDVHFPSIDEGWAVGDDPYRNQGVLLHYTGGTWTSVTPPTVSGDWSLKAVHFTSPHEGWAVGDESVNNQGVLLHYTGGIWTSVIPPYVSPIWNLNAVHSISPNEGWAVGHDWEDNKGVLLRYSKGKWTSVHPPCVSTNWVLNAVHSTSLGEAWAVGYDYSLLNHTGVLLHFQSSSPILPDEGTIGTEIQIKGSGYGKTKGKLQVGNVPTKILQWADSSIRCRLTKVPLLGTYDVTIQPKGSSPLTLPVGFSVMPPEISYVEPQSGSMNDQITIYGSFFGTKKGKVTLGGRSCRVKNWTMDATTGESEIEFVVPKRLTPGVNELKIINGAGSNTITFTVE